MVYYIKDGELYHHGIKGQKWGRRRFQKKDGSLTSEGKNRYKKKSLHRRRLEEKYMKKGMSKADAEKAASKRIKVEIAVGAAAAVTVAACAAYYARNKWVENHCDQVLKKGTQFHNLDGAENRRPGEHLYVNYRQNDKNYFRGHFALNKLQKSGHVYDHVVTAENDIKIPSMDTRKSVFKQLYDSDESFRTTINTHSNLSSDLKSSKVAYKNMWQRFGDKDDPTFNVAKRKYFEALKEKGYDAVVDEWDTNKRVFRSDAPLILLDTSSKSFGDMTIKELNGKDVLVAQANSRWYEPVRTAKTFAGAPHTNHFKESAGSLSRYAKKAAKNDEYITKVLNESGKDNFDAWLPAMQRKGSIYADAGKYMTKNKGMSVSDAIARATRKSDNLAKIRKASYGTASVASMYAPALAVSKAVDDARVRAYIKEHPNTKLTTTEIQKRIKEGRI